MHCGRRDYPDLPQCRSTSDHDCLACGWLTHCGVPYGRKFSQPSCSACCSQHIRSSHWIGLRDRPSSRLLGCAVWNKWSHWFDQLTLADQKCFMYINASINLKKNKVCIPVGYEPPPVDPLSSGWCMSRGGGHQSLGEGLGGAPIVGVHSSRPWGVHPQGIMERLTPMWT